MLEPPELDPSHFATQRGRSAGKPLAYRTRKVNREHSNSREKPRIMAPRVILPFRAHLISSSLLIVSLTPTTQSKQREIPYLFSRSSQTAHPNQQVSRKRRLPTVARPSFIPQLALLQDPTKKPRHQYSVPFSPSSGNLLLFVVFQSPLFHIRLASPHLAILTSSHIKS